MPDTTVQITDTELASRLKSSFIDPTQQKQLEGLIPKMNEGEKTELLKLIDRSHAEQQKANAAYQENMENLGKEYKQRLKEEDKNFRGELEGIEQTENAENLKVIEAEVTSIGVQSKIKKQRSGGHFVRNLILLVLFFGLLAGAGLYMLNTMS
jgi:replicative superfamily II helicase